jgi:hypothetical protein
VAGGQPLPRAGNFRLFPPAGTGVLRAERTMVGGEVGGGAAGKLEGTGVWGRRGGEVKTIISKL